MRVLQAELNEKVESAISGCSTTVYFCNTFILCLLSRIIKSIYQGVYFMRFSSQIFLKNCNHGDKTVRLKKNSLQLYPVLWLCLLNVFMKLYCTETVSYLLKWFMYDFLLHSDSKLKHMVRLPNKKGDRVLGIYSGVIW